MTTVTRFASKGCRSAWQPLWVTGLSVAALLSAPAGAAPESNKLDIVDRVPKFEKFYVDASSRNLDEPARWAAWQKDYGIAAVPPTPEGDALARRQLDEAWARYPALILKLSGLESEAERTARNLFVRVNEIYATGGVSIHTKLILFVGQFDGNEFTMPSTNGQPPTVVMPVENPALEVDLAHELSHSVHFQLAGVKSGFGAAIGETIFLEGLAMHASKAIVPGLPDEQYTELANEPGWLARCRAQKGAVMQGIIPFLNSSGGDVATKFTFGRGTTGMDRELYCAGWFIVGRLLEHGKTFAQLARIPEHRMVQTVRDAIVGRPRA